MKDGNPDGYKDVDDLHLQIRAAVEVNTPEALEFAHIRHLGIVGTKIYSWD